MNSIWALFAGDSAGVYVRFILGAAFGMLVYKGYLTSEQSQTILDTIYAALPTWALSAVPGGLALFLSIINKQIDTQNKTVRPPNQGGRKSMLFGPVHPTSPDVPK